MEFHLQDKPNNHHKDILHINNNLTYKTNNIFRMFSSIQITLNYINSINNQDITKKIACLLIWFGVT